MARVSAIVAGAALALVLVAGDQTPEAIEQPIALVVRPQILIARGDVRAELRIARDVDNRLVDLAWTSDVQAGRTVRGIDGDDGPALIAVALPDLPPAHYIFTATLYGQAGEVRGRARADILAADRDGGSR